jgi:hypothetical protein
VILFTSIQFLNLYSDSNSHPISCSSSWSNKISSVWIFQSLVEFVLVLAIVITTLFSSHFPSISRVQTQS